MDEQVKFLHEQVEDFFGRHPNAERRIRRRPAPLRYCSAKARKNYAGTSPITRASGKKKVVTAQHVRNDRLIDALIAQAFSALRVSPGARAYYENQRARGVEFNAALRQLANRLVGILHSARLPENRHTVRRCDRLVPSSPRTRRLTLQPS
ncbi:transposase [Kitasatospora sp. NPDC093806]|uniref:transposase n=1 Tax=Kitasatospora sp. NPDC093806 TaxID=3155075 RepID=UPI0034141B62